MADSIAFEWKPFGWWQQRSRAAIINRLNSFQGDQLVLTDSLDQLSFGESEGEEPPIELIVSNPRFYWRTLSRGPLGAAESWMDGDWQCSDLSRLIRLMIRNQVEIDQLDRGLARWQNWLERFLHWRKKNTVRSSKSNIREHYDLGNDFFSLFLDPTMNYSSAVFESLGSEGPSESLHLAQLRKMQRLCETLQLSPNDHLLEIGTGWGSLACFAAQQFGCRVTTTTISHEQFRYAQERVRQQGLEERVTVLDQDYRLLDGKFDKIVSVEMIEAVGDQYYDTFFQQCRRLLRPEGLLLLQAITIVDQRYDKHLNSVDFICKYIFPGGSLPCISRLVSSAASSAEMRLIQLNDYAAHYAETLRRWRQRFWKQIEAIRGLGYSEKFIRMWDYYLAYCEAAFDERQINLVHALFAQRTSQFVLVQASHHMQSSEATLGERALSRGEATHPEIIEFENAI